MKITHENKKNEKTVFPEMGYTRKTYLINSRKRMPKDERRHERKRIAEKWKISLK